jgi:hypothetical protein
LRSWKRGAAMIRWSLTNPAWVERDATALRLHRYLKISFITVFGAWLWLFAMAIFFPDVW